MKDVRSQINYIFLKDFTLLIIKIFFCVNLFEYFYSKDKNIGCACKKNKKALICCRVFRIQNF